MLTPPPATYKLHPEDSPFKHRHVPTLKRTETPNARGPSAAKGPAGSLDRKQAIKPREVFCEPLKQT